MRVRAKRVTNGEMPKVVAFYNDRRIREGDEFDIPDEPIVEKTYRENGVEKKVMVPKMFSVKWMEKVDSIPSVKERKIVNEVKMSSGDMEVI